MLIDSLAMRTDARFAHALWRALFLLAIAVHGCASSSSPDGGDAGVPDDHTAADGAADEAPSDGFDVQHVRTCSELVVRRIDATPGQAGRGYPGSQLVIQGDGFEIVDRVVVGSIEQPFTRLGGTIVSSIPPMLAVGPQTVIVEGDRCMAAGVVLVSRLVAVVRRNQGVVDLLDASDVTLVGTLNTGLASITQATFTLDGANLIARGADGRIVRAIVGGGAATSLSPHSTAPFELAQGTVIPTQALLVVPGGEPAGVRKLDTIDGTAVPLADALSLDPISVSVSLDGFRSLVLERDGSLLYVDRAFARVPLWQRLDAWTPVASARTVAISQGSASATNHRAAVFQTTSPPAVTSLNALAGAPDGRVEVPGALGNMFFITGDFVVLDSDTPDVITVDIELDATLIHIPLRGEIAGPVTRTQLSPTLYYLGALVTRPHASGTAQSDVLHVLDFHYEPAHELESINVPGARGVVGMQGRGNPFLLWTARAVVRALGEAPDPVNFQRFESPADRSEIAFVAVQR